MWKASQRLSRPAESVHTLLWQRWLILCPLLLQVYDLLIYYYVRSGLLAQHADNVFAHIPGEQMAIAGGKSSHTYSELLLYLADV